MNRFNEAYTKVIRKFLVKEGTTSYKIPQNRERTGGITPGDRIKFVENILSSDWFKTQASNIQDLVRELHDGDLNLFVDGVTEDNGDINAVIARELAPGLQCPYSKVTLPANLCEFIASTGDRATAPIPDSWRGPERVTIKPELVKPLQDEGVDTPEDQTSKADDGTGKLQETDNSLPEKNTPGEKGGTYTSNYLP